MNAIKLSLVFVVALFLASACKTASSPNTANAPSNADTSAKDSPKAAATVDVIAQGKELFATNCMICHKENGTGGPVTVNGKKLKPDNLVSDKMKTMPDDKLIGYVSEGVEDEGMPAFKDKLSPQEIKLIVAHVRRLQGP